MLLLRVTFVTIYAVTFYPTRILLENLLLIIPNEFPYHKCSRIYTHARPGFGFCLGILYSLLPNKSYTIHAVGFIHTRFARGPGPGLLLDNI